MIARYPHAEPAWADGDTALAPQGRSADIGSGGTGAALSQAGKVPRAAFRLNRPELADQTLKEEVPMPRDTSFSFADARRITKAEQAKAAEMGSPSNIVVVDAGGHRQGDQLQRIFDYERLAFPHEKQLP